jgi:CRISPR-associated protein Cas2
MKTFMVVAYDVSDNRRRNKVADILEKVGLRCNESVFECMLTDSQMVQLKKNLTKYCDVRKDSLLFYSLCRDCVSKRDVIGLSPKRDVMIVVV